MLTWFENLFYVAFLGQIFAISYYFPRKILGRMRYVMDTYPPSQYPKLYPKPVEYYRMGQWGFKVANNLIVLLGFLIMLAMLFVVDHSSFADDGFISEAWPAAYGIIQFLPLVFLEISEFSQFKLMRKANVATTRKAELRRRSLLKSVSPLLLVSAIVLYLATLVLGQYVHQFEFDWSHDTVQRAIVLTVTNLFLAAIGAWNLYGRKQNPHQAFEDRARQTAANLHSLLYVSMAMSVFFMTQAMDDLYDLDFLDATLTSLYFQFIVVLSTGHLLRSLSLKDINFDVYKNNGTAIHPYG